MIKNKEALVPKLDTLARCILRVESKKPFSLDQLQRDYDLKDIISINLERAVQQCVDIAAHLIADAELQAPSTMS